MYNIFKGVAKETFYIGTTETSDVIFKLHFTKESWHSIYQYSFCTCTLNTVTVEFINEKMNVSKGFHLIRRFSTTAVRNSHAHGGPGSNLPFDIYSKYKFTVILAIYFSSGFGLPFLMVRYVKHRAL